MSNLTPLDCGGSQREIGRQYGRARRLELAAAVDDLAGLLALFPQQAAKADITRAALALLPASQSCHPEAVEFIRGQAEGAGLPLADVLSLHCLLELMFNLGNPAPMCTSFALTGPATRDGRTMAGQNVDWFTCSRVDVLRIHHADGGKALAVCLFGAPYYHLTSAGMCSCANLTLGPLASGPQTPLCVYLAKAMRQPSLEPAMAVIESFAQGLGYHHLADGQGRMLGIESVSGSRQTLRPVDGVLVHANHYESERFKPLDAGLDFMPDSPRRSTRLRELIAEHHGRITVEDMMALMADHQGHPNSICRHPDPSAPPALATDSRASLIMLPREGVLWIADGPPCSTRYQEIAL